MKEDFQTWYEQVDDAFTVLNDSVYKGGKSSSTTYQDAINKVRKVKQPSYIPSKTVDEFKEKQVISALCEAVIDRLRKESYGMKIKREED